MDGVTDSMDMTLSKLWEIIKDREAWRAAVHRVKQSYITKQLNHTTDEPSGNSPVTYY